MSTTTTYQSRQTPPRRSSGAVLAGALVILIGATAAFWGISTRARSLTTVAKETEEMALPTVAVAAPTRDTMSDEIVLPGTMQPLMEASIYPRTTGYLRKWYADIGTRVKAGQVLAEIDAPEVDQQLMQARADLATAQANTRLAHTTAERYRDLIQSDSVSRQDLDNANGNLEAKQAAEESARANVKRLEQLQAFRRIEAPFDGVVTARNTEVGALIDSGSNAKELFHVAQMNKLRVFINVPQVYSQAATQGLTAELTLKEFPGKRFTGRLARTANAIDVASRTLLTEIDIDNSNGQLLAGSYAEVHLKLPTPATTMKLPVDALIFKGDSPQVARLDGANRVRMVDITPGRDFGDSVEVLAGVSPTDRLVLNPPDSLVDGQTVRVAQAAPRGEQK